MEIWKKLRELREGMNLSYESLYSELNKEISVSTLKSYDSKNPKNRRIISPRNAEILSNYFKVPKEYLLYEDFEIKKKENIDINEILGFSDKTIDNIKRVNKKYNVYLNLLFEELHFDLIASDLKQISILKEYFSICETLLSHGSGYNKIDIISYLNSIKIIEESKYSPIKDIIDSMNEIIDSIKSKKNEKEIKKEIDNNCETLINHLNRLNEKIGYYKYDINKSFNGSLDMIFENQIYV